MKSFEKARLLFHTVKNLKFIQIKEQLLKRIVKESNHKKHILLNEPIQIQILIPELDTDKEYLSRFDVEALMQGRVLLLHEMHLLNSSWNVGKVSHLWNYNLHYLEFLIPLAVRYHASGNEEYREKYLEILTSWLETMDDNKDAYAPYTISMRIPNVLIGMEMLGVIEEPLKNKIYQSLYNQYRYLLQHPELALLANHYFENLKTIVIASILFGESDVYRKYFDLFLKQIGEQILSDGLHFERSLMYHKIILEDILRVYMVLQSSGHETDAEKLLPTIKNMASAMGSLERNMKHTPLFNDAGDNVSKPTAALLIVCKKICGDVDTGKTEFPDAGYYRMDSGSGIVLFDCGDIGPKYMAGHAQNDCLSFELSVGGERIFVNSGTGQYQGGMRQFFRSTKAHNTLMIDDREQSELWGEHRAARRISGIKTVVKEREIMGQFKSYHGDGFRRKMQWQGTSLMISDDIRCGDSDRHTARQFFHLVPGYRFERDGNSVKIISGNRNIAIINPPENADLLIHTDGEITTYAGDFGMYEKKLVLELRTFFEKAVRLNTKISVVDHKGLQC